MRKLMAIFAHPDDEGAIGGTLAHYATNGTEVTLVCATRGEVGEISDETLATPETLGEVRQKELETASAALGIQHLEFLPYRDSGMVDTPENEDPRALVQADPAAFQAAICALFDKYKPEAVITFEPFGWYGHPDHMAVSKWVTELFPPEALPGHQPARLFHAVLPISRWGRLIQAAIEAGYIEENSFGDRPIRPEQLATEAAVTHVIDTKAQYDRRDLARQAHRTQFGPDHMFSKIPKEMMLEMSSQDHFIQVYPDPRRDDLFS